MEAKQETSASVTKQKFLDNANADGAKSPLVKEQDDGQYQVTFWYRLSDADKPIDGVKIGFSVDCPDLYEKMLDDKGELKKMDEIPNTGLYYLTLNNVPSNTFATYHMNKVIGDKTERIVDHSNTNSIQIPKFNIQKSEVIPQETAYFELPEAKLPVWANRQPSSQIKGEVTHEIFLDKSDPSDRAPFPERDVWVYKPERFDELTANNREIIFILDGQDLCETLTPYIDRKGEPFSKAAIVFIDAGRYQTPGPPGRVREDYFRTHDFSNLLAEQIIPTYCQKLGINNKDNVTLAAHSLAAFPMIDVATNHPDLVGGLILASPALNQVGELLPEAPNPESKKIAIFMQIGEKENEKPPKPHSDSTNPDTYRGLKDESRLASNQEFHAKLLAEGYTVTPELVIHPFGHDTKHVFEGLERGMQFIHEARISQKLTSEDKSSTAVISDPEKIKHCQHIKEELSRLVETSRDTPPDLTQSTTLKRTS